MCGLKEDRVVGREQFRRLIQSFSHEDMKSDWGTSKGDRRIKKS